ncbi:transmembrane protein [Cavenderia fasciculata]|uniref:Transmembrane protein n=1 Tax=Cavenderia fasciculata TaxID=261658 RepID=F4QEV9_CACFS|nr:uncharacterized protein DFA_11935 [Cavenderia fasciculata]EGG14166.1 transmembrane protein [Cavenderia fasciculata]|eukprot:XP_004350874.1 transmembrane protein [Cavenderia fasciculata]
MSKDNNSYNINSNNENAPLLNPPPPSSAQEGQLSDKTRRIAGIVIVILIAVLQTALSEIGQTALVGFNKPFFVCLSGSMFVFLAIPIELIVLKAELHKKAKENEEASYNRSINDQNETKDLSMIEALREEFSNLSFTFLLIIVNWMFMIGLTMTVDKPTVLKVAYVLLFVAGVVGITVADQLTGSDSSQYPNAVKGDIIMVASAVLWATYEVFVNKMFSKATRTVLNFFVGMNTFNMLVVGIPILAILNAIKFETFEFPDKETFGALALMGSLSFALIYVMNIGLSITSPLFVRSGELMSIPGTLLWDIVFKHVKFPLVAIPGFSAIIFGFILSLYAENKAMKDHEEATKKEQEQQQNEVIQDGKSYKSYDNYI